MANVFLTPDVIAQQSLATLYETTVMLPLVYRDVDSEFAAKKIGNTVDIRKPAVFTGKVFDRANGIELQDATEDSIPVKLTTIADVSFAVTSEDLTMEIDRFDEQLLSPAMEAIAQQIDRAILALRSDITQEVGVTPASRTWDKPESLIEAGKVLNLKSVPLTERRAVVGPSMYAEWLDTDLLKQANTSGTTDALRNANIGDNLFGFNTFWTQNVEPAKSAPATGDPTTEVGVGFHRTAFCIATAPLEIAPGSNASVMSYRGISIRVAYAYDITKKQTVVSLDTLFGVKTLDANRAVLIKGADKAA